MRDKITWQIVPQTIRTDTRAKALERAIVTDCPDAPVADVRWFTLLLSCTKGLEFRETTARSALHSLKQFVERDASGMTGAELWAYYLDLHLQLWHAWIKGFNESQELFDTDPAELPTAALTAEQRLEAETPGSPLT